MPLQPRHSWPRWSSFRKGAADGCVAGRIRRIPTRIYGGMSKTAFLFPGQGSQFVGMGRDLFEAYPEARDRFEKADRRLGFSLSDTMFGASSDETLAEEALKQTDVTQPALYVHSLAAVAVLEAHGLSPDVAAGHSLGEYSALAAAGAIDFEDGLEIVRLRGRLMADAGDRRPGTMAAILGMDDDDVTRLCLEATEAPDSVVQAANFNSPGQVVISGDRSAIDRAVDLAKERGAKRAIPLPVSGAFHSPLMERARDGLAEGLIKLEISSPRVPVYLNVTAEPTSEPETIRECLLEQLMSPVRWSQTMRRMQADGATRFVEVGAGNVLSGLVRRTLGREVETATAGTADEVEAITAEART